LNASFDVRVITLSGMKFNKAKRMSHDDDQ